MGTGTEEDPVGFLGTEAFPCPPFLVWREQTSVSLMFLEFQWPKSKQLAISEERRHRDKGEQPRSNGAGFEWGPGPTSRDTQYL